jgi:uncharacterized protein
MSHENVELVRRVFTLWNRASAGEEQALDIAAECFDADIEWHDQRELPGATVHHGIEEVGQHIAASQEALDYDRAADLLELLDVDRRVLAAYRIRAHGRSSGAPVERESFHVYTFRGGRIASVEIFGNRSDALQAAGLSESISEEIDEQVRRGYDAWNRRDFDAALALADPDIEWTMIGTTRFMAEGTYHGHDGVREFWRLLIEPWAELHIETEGTRAAGDLVVAFVRFRAKARDGLELEHPFVHLLDFRDGKWTRFRSFDDRAEALEVAGLSE